MKILYISHSSSQGGVEQHVLDLTHGMVRSGHEVLIWAPFGYFTTHYQKAGAKCFDRKVKYDFDCSYIISLVKFLIANKIDVIHAHELRAVANGLFSAFLAQTKIRISHIHTPISDWKINPLAKLLNCVVYSMCVNLFGTYDIALTSSRRKLKLKEGIYKRKIKVIPNAIDASRFSLTPKEKNAYRTLLRNKYKIPSSSFVFGNIGRHSVEKGIDVLLKAFARFLEMNIPNNGRFYLLLAGGGELEEVNLALSKTLGIEKQVTITGRFPDEEKLKFLSVFDCFVFPTTAEGWGIVLAEALAFELPVLCSDLEVLKEVGKDYVIYAKQGNSYDWANKLQSVYESVSRETITSTKPGRNYIKETYSLDRFVSSYLNLYTKI